MTAEREARGEIIHGDGGEKKTLDKALGEDGMNGRRGACREGRGVREISWEMHFGGGRS